MAHKVKFKDGTSKTIQAKEIEETDNFVDFFDEEDNNICSCNISEIKYIEWIQER